MPVLIGLGACSIDTAPYVSIPSVCVDQVYADPTVKELIMKGAGSSDFARNHEDDLKYAKLDASHRCMQQKGLIRPGGGVARQAVHS